MMFYIHSLHQNTYIHIHTSKNPYLSKTIRQKSSLSLPISCCRFQRLLLISKTCSGFSRCLKLMAWKAFWELETVTDLYSLYSFDCLYDNQLSLRVYGTPLAPSLHAGAGKGGLLWGNKTPSDNLLSLTFNNSYCLRLMNNSQSHQWITARAHGSPSEYTHSCFFQNSKV